MADYITDEEIIMRARELARRYRRRGVQIIVGLFVFAGLVIALQHRFAPEAYWLSLIVVLVAVATSAFYVRKYFELLLLREICSIADESVERNIKEILPYDIHRIEEEVMSKARSRLAEFCKEWREKNGTEPPPEVVRSFLRDLSDSVHLDCVSSLWGVFGIYSEWRSMDLSEVAEKLLVEAAKAVGLREVLESKKEILKRLERKCYGSYLDRDIFGQHYAVNAIFDRHFREWCWKKREEFLKRLEQEVVEYSCRQE